MEMGNFKENILGSTLRSKRIKSNMTYLNEIWK